MLLAESIRRVVIGSMCNRQVIEGPPPSLPLEWIEKTYFFTVNLGRIRFGGIRLKTRQLWTAFPACLNHPQLPSVSRRDLDGVDAVWIPGYPVSRNFPALQFPPGVIQYMTWSDTRFLIPISGTFNDLPPIQVAKHAANTKSAGSPLAGFGGRGSSDQGVPGRDSDGRVLFDCKPSVSRDLARQTRRRTRRN